MKTTNFHVCKFDDEICVICNKRQAEPLSTPAALRKARNHVEYERLSKYRGSRNTKEQ